MHIHVVLALMHQAKQQDRTIGSMWVTLYTRANPGASPSGYVKAIAALKQLEEALTV